MSQGATVSRASLVRLCRAIGDRVPAWTQGTGGNASAKEGGSGGALVVKASGVRLDAVAEGRGLCEVPLAPLRRALGRIRGEGDGATRAYDRALEGGRTKRDAPRPSMEAGLHALLPGRVVAHFHSLAAILMACERSRATEAVDAFLAGRPGWRVAFVRPVVPGWPLARAVAANAGADAIVLQGHGVVVQADEADRILAWVEVERAFCRAFGLPRVLALLDDRVTREAAADLLAGPGPFAVPFPDAAVFADRVRAVLVPAPAAGEARFELAPGALAADPDAAEVWLAIRALLAERPDLPALPEGVATAAGGLEAEAYRRRIGVRAARSA